MLVAGLTVAQQLPWLLFALPAGVLVDRLERRGLMWRTDILRAAAIAGFGVLVALDAGGILALYVVAFVLGAAETVFDTAYRSFLPRLVAPAALERANARLYAAETVTNRLAGPPLGGVLFAVAVSVPLFLDAASFALAALLVLGIATTARAAAPPAGAVTSAIVEGLRWLWRHRLLRWLAVIVSIWHLAWAAGTAILVLYAEELLGVGGAGFGLLLAAGALGGIAGTGLTAPLVRTLGRRLTIVASIAIGAVGELVLALTSATVIAALALALAGAGALIWNVITVALRQRLVPDELLGRVNAAYRFAAIGSIAVGAVLGGLLGSISLRLPYAVAAGVLTLTAAIALVVLSREGEALAGGDG
jgi:MFS family permease